MPASLVEIEIEGGISALKCPITGIPVIVKDEGFSGEAQHSPHLRFFVDWIAELWAAHPTDLPKDQAVYMKKVLAIFAKPTKKDNQRTLIGKCLKVLPKSAMVLEILDPPRGSFGGEICYVCFDLGEPAKKATIRLECADIG